MKTTSPDGYPRSKGVNHKSKIPWLAVPIILGAMSLLTAGYLISFNTIRITDDQLGKPIEVRTHQRTVEGALREAGITVFVEDIVSPSPASELKREDAINIKRAITTRVRVGDDEPKLIRTQAKSAKELLAGLGANVGERDLVLVNGAFTFDLPGYKLQSRDAVADVQFKRAVAVNVQETGHPDSQIATTADTVGEALMQAGNIIYLADIVKPGLDERISAGANIAIQRSKPVSIIVDGRRIKTRTQKSSVADLLSELNIALYDQDYTKPALSTSVSNDMEVRVVRLKREVVVDQTLLPFDTRWQPDGEMELDTQTMAQEGAPGVHERRTLVTLEDGATVKKQLVADFIAREIQPKIFKFGTKIVVRTLNTPEGPVEYWRKIRMLATSYTASRAGVSPTAPWYGITRCGIPMRGGIVAVDPRLIPLRTNIYVDGYGKGYACDTGSGIKGKRVDLGYPEDAFQSWRSWTDVYIQTPVPGNVDYILDDN